MIQANELRIGNYVNMQSGIAEWFFQEIKITVEHLVSLDDRYKPITLSEEWLLKFGFEQDVKFFKHENFEVERQDGLFWYRTINDYLEVTHIHQLQNLYFALTGKELS